MATAAIGVPVVLILVYLGSWPFLAGVGIVAGVGSMELYQMTRHAGYHPVWLLGVPAAIALACLPILNHRPAPALLGIVVALLFTTGIYGLLGGAYEKALPSLLVTLFPVVYIGLLLSHLSLLRELSKGGWWVFLALILTWAYDTGAFIGGKLVGRHRFMAHVSPHKTVEGVMGGLLLATVAGLLSLPTLGLNPWQGLLIGALAAVTTQAGDLLESMLKRQTGVKDSGVIIPGHGGLLDRIDGLLFTGALVYYAAALLGYAS